MEMTPQRWEKTCRYIAAVFGDEDEQRRTLMARAREAGIPQIAVSPDVGRTLRLLASMTNAGRGARLGVEVGTLAGYSALWIAGGLAAEGRLICVEPESRHADFAQREFDRAGVGRRIEIRRDTGLNVLAALLKERGEGSVDFIFLDAIKTEYPEYFRLARPLLASGGVLAADNCLGSSEWWIDDAPGSNESRDAIDMFNRMVAADPWFESTCIPNKSGLAVARRKG